MKRRTCGVHVHKKRKVALPAVIKVKVGGDAGPVADATRAVKLLSETSRGAGSSLRLDANQAWSLEDALCFTAALVAEAEVKGKDDDHHGASVKVEGKGVEGGVRGEARGVDVSQVT